MRDVCAMRASTRILLLLLATALPAAAQSQLGQNAPAAPRAAAAPTGTPTTAPTARPTATQPRRPEAARPPATSRPAANGQRPRTPTTAGNRPRTTQPRRPVAPPVTPPPPAAAATPEPPPPEPTQGSATGLPLPRFVPLRSDRVNLRVGPDTRFPVEWRYERRDLPVQIIREHEQWRRIRDVDGTEGWVHQSNLTPNRRTFLIRANPTGEVLMRRRPETDAPAIARLRPGVIGRLRACDPASTWCEIQAGENRGFVPRGDLFGVLPGEKVE